MFIKRFFKIFFTKEFNNFELSQLEFRKRILKVLQISLNIFIGLFMIIIFPISKLNIYYYVFFPIFLVLNNLMVFILKLKNRDSWFPRYFFFFQITLQTIAMELALTRAENYGSKRVFLMGIQVGLIQIMSALSLYSSLLKITSSLIFFFQLCLRIVIFEAEFLYSSLFVIMIILILSNIVFYRFEMLNYSIWNSYMKSNMGLLHFQQLIDIFPSQIAVVNKISFDEDRPLYLNQEAERYKDGIFLGKKKGFKAFLDLFKIEKTFSDKNIDLKYPKQRVTLKIFVKELLDSKNSVGDFKKISSGKMLKTIN